MPNAPQSRLMAEAHSPRIALLWKALAGLRSSVGFLNTGAHPDDETSEMLAALWLRDGVKLSYACSTRGEGGQNDIGTEAGSVLGTLRTAEMEAAAEALDMRLYWHGQSIDDPVTDFGFSKSGTETMGKWGHDRLMRRFVEILRQDRPDILCPTFLDIPGQHGHHRAMTAAAFEVIGLAADPAYAPDGPAPWQVSKLYLPAWSGAGGAYDDEVPPPPATVTVAGTGIDPVLGSSYARIGQYSRQFHRTQGMGRWVTPEEEQDWPLHLAWSDVGGDMGQITDNLPQTLADIGCAEAQSAISDCVAAFPDGAAIADAAARALAALDNARVDPLHAHRVARKQAQLARVLMLALNIDPRALPQTDRAAPGAHVAIATKHRLTDRADITLSLVPGESQKATGTVLEISTEAAPSDPYPDSYDPLVPRAPYLAAEIRIDGLTTTACMPFERPILTLPAARARLSDTAAILNLSTETRELTLNVGDPSSGAPAFTLPEGWTQTWSGGQVTLRIPDHAAPGLYDLSLTLDRTPARTLRIIDYDHITPRLHHSPAILRVRLAHITPPPARVAYIGAGNDRVAYWLSAAGFDLTVLEDADLGGDTPFAGFDTVLVGVFAHRFRPALKSANARLNAWVRDGGTLVTLYHRPWDDWDPDTVPPARLEIGQPSLRWRITDESAEVTVLATDAPILSYPNPIKAEDWAGWHKERGLYFAKAWDPAYTPVLRMADPDEQPLDGALLVGEIGAGRHVHIALNLHHQVTQLVPGAYRLFANALTPRSPSQ
ncbi:PIG-L family deacetylase [Gymnodinialimonas sp. 2305UL16-5]|uniref:PIG-L family deacetylase n=1 Tax=Gymnodinialimonas mytili TaxID=3126503 RepID=UPI0030B41485